VASETVQRRGVDPMDEWLEAAAQRLAERADDDSDTYHLTDREIERILDLAGVAAHEGDQKTNVPLL
jgi:hypothetical protein